jgi:hypothetical protein
MLGDLGGGVTGGDAVKRALMACVGGEFTSETLKRFERDRGRHENTSSEAGETRSRKKHRRVSIRTRWGLANSRWRAAATELAALVIVGTGTRAALSLRCVSCFGACAFTVRWQSPSDVIA